MDKKKKLLALLSTANHPVTGKELSSRLNVSDRTIRNYIREINEEKLIIQSSSNGYWITVLDSPCNKRKIESSLVYDFSSQNERLLYIAERIITSSEEADLYDIADDIYISYSTIEKDLIQIRGIIKDFHLTLLRGNGKATIQGSEESKRSFIRYLLSQQDSATVQNTLHAICEDIHIPFDTLKDLIIYQTRQQKLYASDYAIKNILTHVIITLSRLQNKYSLQLQSSPSAKEKEPESICAANIIQEIETNYNIMFNTEEKNQLIFLLMSKTTRLDHNNQTRKYTQDFISLEYIEFTKQLVENINYIYYIDLNDSDFINFFSLHLKNVLFRWNNNTFNTNPFSDQIFIQNPLIYDIAVYIANEIRNRYHCKLNKDEITFISLHIGAVIEKKAEESHTYKALLIMNEYYYPVSNYLYQFQKEFQNKIDIVSIMQSIHLIDTESIDFIIDASGEQNRSYAVPMVYISPLFDRKDLNKVYDFLNKLIDQQHTNTMKHQFHSFFSKDMFELEHYEPDANAMIRYISQKLIDAGIAPASFTQSVLEREEITSTSFDNKVAIPHSILCSTSRNCSYVIVNKTPMKWGYFEVNIIIMIGINHNQRRFFKELYSNLLEKLQDITIIQELIKVKSYDAFIKLLTGEC